MVKLTRVHVHDTRIIRVYVHDTRKIRVSADTDVPKSVNSEIIGLHSRLVVRNMREYAHDTRITRVIRVFTLAHMRASLHVCALAYAYVNAAYV